MKAFAIDADIEHGTEFEEAFEAIIEECQSQLEKNERKHTSNFLEDEPRVHIVAGSIDELTDANHEGKHGSSDEMRKYIAHAINHAVMGYASKLNQERDDVMPTSTRRRS